MDRRCFDMDKVRQRKRDMVEGMIAVTLQQYKASGAELIMGAVNSVAPKTLEVRLTSSSRCRLIPSNHQDSAIALGSLT
jgi:hypothetical protein